MLWKTRRTFITKPLFLAAAGAACALPVVAHAEPSSVSAPVIRDLRKPVGLKTAVVAAIDNGGDADVAMRALKATNMAMARSTGYAVIAPSTVAANLKKAGLRYPFLPRDYEKLKKILDKADRAVAVTITPAEASDTNKTYKALVEMFDTTNGGLVGRGEATYTASEEPAPAEGAAPAADSDSPRLLAVDGAIIRAINKMNEPVQLNGIVLSRPAQNYVRLSLGEMHGLRNGTRLEYVVNGEVVAYGTAVDIGKAESLATVAPERAFPLVAVNGSFRTVDVPPLGAAGRTAEQFNDKEWKKFERDFGIGVAVVGAAYLIFLREGSPSFGDIN